MRSVIVLKGRIDKLFFEGDSEYFNNVDKELFQAEYNYFLEFFEVRYLKFDEAFNFIFNSDEENVRYRNKFMELFHLDSDEKEYYFDRYQHSENLDIFKELFLNKDFDKLYKNVVKAILWLSFYDSDAYDYQKSESSKTDLALIESYKNNRNDFTSLNYFRGQSDYSWQLKPSLLRGFDFKSSKADGCIIDLDKLYDIYSRVGLIEKYNKTIGNGKIKCGKDIDYKFLAFMQHAISYSPLIDFSSDIEVAYKFALSKNSPNTYLQKNSALFILDFGQCSTNAYIYGLKELNIRYLNKKIRPGSIMYVEDVSGKNIPLDFSSISKIKKLLKPEYAIFDEETNDRMKYQKGKFVLFYNYVSVNGNVYYMLNKRMKLIKKKISIASKNSILSAIDSNLNNSYLMNPYQIFND